MTRFLATVFYVGLLRPAPGTWGSLAALPLAYALHLAGGFAALLAASIAVLALGWWTTKVETDGKDDHDPSEIVIDEVLGMFIALWPVSYGAVMMGADVLRLWPGILTAFLAFRLFDIWKPGPVGWADRKRGPFGVMLDDAIAGALAAVVVIAFAAVAHGLLI